LLHFSCNFNSGSGSGGYAENVLTYAAEHILNTRLDRIVFEAQKNPDLREVTVKSETGDTVLKFAIANGFRNIQNLVQKMKRKRCDYDLVEIMACPSGCLNGGAQLRQGQLIRMVQCLFGP
jgi:iron only hydrogenase large subunit-like protein